ncbi:MAG: M12 family metallo-peptidase [Bacteroidota bacterium]
MFYFTIQRKSYALLFVLFFVGSANAQEVFVQTTPESSIVNQANEILSEVDFYQVDIHALKNRLNTTGPIEVSVPIGHRPKIVHLQKTNILSPDYKLFTSSGQTLKTAQKYSFYKGTVDGKINSKVVLIYFDDAFSMSIFDDDGNYEIHRQDDYYAGYYDDDRIEPIDLDWECQVIDESNGKSEPIHHGTRSDSDPECVTVFLEIDNNMYVKKGSSIPNTEEWAMTLFAQVAILFIEHDVPLNISGIQVWDTQDPYTSASNTSGALSLFRSAVQQNPNFNGRLAHLLSGRSLGGGIAYLNSLCSTFSNVAVSANLNGGNTPYPSYSWNVMVVAHEIGHNMGSPHTQSCSWNGNNTAIDGCGNIEGSCADPGNPPNNVGGTIMSYCHLTSSGINFKNGFGLQPGALIRERYHYASCVTGENCSHVPPFNDVCGRAKEIPILNYCVQGEFSNYATTPSGDGGNMSCGNTGVENDIWFQFEYLDLDTIRLVVEASQYISDLVVQVYSGDCDNLTTLDCGFSTNGEQVPFEFYDPALINETIYIRIVEKDSDEEGKFTLCTYSEELPCQTQLDTLKNIYQDLDGTNWTHNTGWVDGILNGACDYCNWYGVTCDYQGNIVKIDLSNNNLNGMLPQDLVALNNLEELYLKSNLLFDTIPNFWDSLDQLIVLDLSYNSFTGAIPVSYTTMTRINTIHLDHNNLGNQIPAGLGFNSSLKTFTASNNTLEGCFSNGVSSFCNKDSINLINNPDLPYNGDVTLLCDKGWGTDWDLDGYCNEIEDCNDYNADIHPDADEILCDALDNNCDGVIDEGSDFGPNIWIGPDTLGVFDDSLNWSLGHLPKICENVEIGMDGDTIHLVLKGNNTEGGTGNGGSNEYFNLQIRNLSIGQNTTIELSEFGNMSILGNGVLENQGIFNVQGYFNIRDQYNTSNTALLNSGVLNITGFGGFSINEIGDYAIQNTSTGIINLSGFSSIDLLKGETALSAILNEGVFNLFGNLWIYGDYEDQEIKNENGGTLEVKNGGSLFVY